MEPHPLFAAFIKASYENRQQPELAMEAEEPQYSRVD
jgi:hypothetical protein